MCSCENNYLLSKQNTCGEVGAVLRVAKSVERHMDELLEGRDDGNDCVTVGFDDGPAASGVRTIFRHQHLNHAVHWNRLAWKQQRERYFTHLSTKYD